MIELERSLRTQILRLATSTDRTVLCDSCHQTVVDPTPLDANAQLRRRDLLGGLINEYEAA